MLLGTNNIADIKLGNNQVDSVYLGTNLVWQKPLLDKFPSAAAAYSLRRLRSAYTGNAIRVRRSSDNTEQDIGFIGQTLDVPSLLSFVGSGSGFVTTWYDQSGNGFDMTQATTTRQPQIVNSGVLRNINGRPAVYGNGTSYILTNPNLVYTTNTWYASCVVRPNLVTTADRVIFSQNPGSGTGRSSILAWSSTNRFYSFFNNGASYGNRSVASPVANTNYIFTTQGYGDAYYTAVNGSTFNNEVSGQSFTPVSASGSSIFGQLNLVHFIIGELSEVLVYNSNQDANHAGIRDNINQFYGIY
jgi:hypothetical protein